MIEFRLKNTIDRLEYIMDKDIFYLLNKDNIMLHNNIKNNIINYAGNKKLIVIIMIYKLHFVFKKYI